MGILQTQSSANWLDGGERLFYRLSEPSKPALSVSVLRIPQMADSTEREVYLLILRGIRTRQCCLKIWTIPLKIFNPFISGQPRVSPSRPNRGMKGLGWLDASCAAILTSESWIEDTKYCPIIAPPFGNSFVKFLYPVLDNFDISNIDWPFAFWPGGVICLPAFSYNLPPPLLHTGVDCHHNDAWRF